MTLGAGLGGESRRRKRLVIASHCGGLLNESLPTLYSMQQPLTTYWNAKLQVRPLTQGRVRWQVEESSKICFSELNELRPFLCLLWESQKVKSIR